MLNSIIILCRQLFCLLGRHLRLARPELNRASQAHGRAVAGGHRGEFGLASHLMPRGDDRDVVALSHSGTSGTHRKVLRPRGRPLEALLLNVKVLVLEQRVPEARGELLLYAIGSEDLALNER